MARHEEHAACLHGNPERPACVLCGKCLAACPLFTATDREELSPKAKFLLADTLLRNPEALSEKKAAALAELCLSCGRCEKACPLGLCAPDLISQLRAAHPDFKAFLFGKFLEKPGPLMPLARALAGLAPKDSRPAQTAAALDPKNALTPWLRVSRFPKNLPPVLTRGVTPFLGCVAKHARTDWRDKTLGLLRALGADPPPDPGFTCCGCALGHAGLIETQISMRRTNIAAWRAAGRPAIAVICATCRCGLRAYAAQFTEFEPGEAALWRDGVVSLSELLLDADFAIDGPVPSEVVYHRPCHGAGGGQDLALLQKAAPNLVRSEKDPPCCGFGGLLQASAPELSEIVARRAFEIHAPKPGAQVLTGCSGCVLRLRASAPPDVAAGHWLEAVRLPDAVS